MLFRKGTTTCRPPLTSYNAVTSLANRASTAAASLRSAVPSPGARPLQSSPLLQLPITACTIPASSESMHKGRNGTWSPSRPVRRHRSKSWSERLVLCDYFPVRRVRTRRGPRSAAPTRRALRRPRRRRRGTAPRAVGCHGWDFAAPADGAGMFVVAFAWVAEGGGVGDGHGARLSRRGRTAGFRNRTRGSCCIAQRLLRIS